MPCYCAAVIAACGGSSKYWKNVKCQDVDCNASGQDQILFAGYATGNI